MVAHMFDAHDSFLDAVIMFSRVLLSLPFLHSGLDKCLHWTAAQREVAASGLPWPTLLHLVTVALHLNFAVIGGLSMIVALGSGRSVWSIIRWGGSLISLQQ
jgi:uncharacterized membrane protein YphA (DoxX/SURF4 family)